MGVLGANTLARGITDTGMAVGAAAALGLGAWRVRDGEMTLGALLVILMLGVEVFRPLRELRVVLHQGMLGLSAAGGIMQILEAQPKVERSSHAAPRRRLALAHRGLRGRDVLLPRRAPGRPRRAVLRGQGGRAGGHRGAERRGQVHGGPAPPPLLRSGARPGDHRRPRHPRADPGPAPRTDRGGEPGHLSLPRHRRGEPPHGQARRDAGRAAGGRARRQRGRVHHAAAPGLPDGGGRARRAAVRWPAPAHRHRPRPPARRADPHPRRSAVLGGRGERGGDPGRRSTGSWKAGPP